MIKNLKSILIRLLNQKDKIIVNVKYYIHKINFTKKIVF